MKLSLTILFLALFLTQAISVNSSPIVESEDTILYEADNVGTVIEDAETADHQLVRRSLGRPVRIQPISPPISLPEVKPLPIIERPIQKPVIGRPVIRPQPIIRPAI